MGWNRPRPRGSERLSGAELAALTPKTLQKLGTKLLLDRAGREITTGYEQSRSSQPAIPYPRLLALGQATTNDMLVAPRDLDVNLVLGDLIDQKYRVLRLLGAGGMGSVYEAENVRVERRVAIKVMRQVRDPKDIARFEREARAAQIGSPHIVQVFDLGYLPNGAPYLVMEYLAGESLGQRLRRVHSLQPAELIPIARQILDALMAAHRAGIVHRDLKPDNVFLARGEGRREEVVKLLDFGISKFIDAVRKPVDVALTKSGVAVGTPHYMSPEQVQGSKALDARSDLYSLGIILYRCLSGELPFQSEEVTPLLVRILMEQAKPLHELALGIDVDLSRIVVRAMSRRPQARFQSADEFRSALVAWERTHRDLLLAAPKDPGLEQAHNTQVPTNPSWSSTAAELPTPARKLGAGSVVVIGGLLVAASVFVAHQLLNSRQPHVFEPYRATEAAAARGAPADPSASLAPGVIVVPTLTVVPTLPLSPTASPGPASQPAATGPLAPLPGELPGASTSTLTPPASFTTLSLPTASPGPPILDSANALSTLSVPSATASQDLAPAFVEPSLSGTAPPTNRDTDPDNRHVSRGVD